MAPFQLLGPPLEDSSFRSSSNPGQGFTLGVLFLLPSPSLGLPQDWLLVLSSDLLYQELP